MRRPRLRTIVIALLVPTVAGAALATWAAFRLGVFEPSVGEQLKAVQKANHGPAWWLGRSFAGLELTRVETASGDRLAAFGYGHCHQHGSKLNPLSSYRCGYPFVVQVFRRRYPLVRDDVPRRADGSCGRTRVRGAPVVVFPGGAIVYSRDEEIGVLGPPTLVSQALARLEPLNGETTLGQPTLRIDPLADCTRVSDHAFAPISSVAAKLHASVGLPLVWTGDWYQSGQLTSAEEVGGSLVLGYTSCRPAQPFATCHNTLAISSQPFKRGLVVRDLAEAQCRTGSVAGAPAVLWTKHESGGSSAGLYVLSGHATIILATDFTLESVQLGPLQHVLDAARALRPEPRLPPPAYNVRSLLRACATTHPIA